MDDLTIELRKTEPVCLIRVSGEVFLPDVASLLAALVRGVRSTRHRAAVCDLTRLRAPLNDWILTAFPASLRRCGGWPFCSLHLAVPEGELREALRRQRMHRYLPIHADLAEAFRQAEIETLAQPFELSLAPEASSLGELRSAVRDLWPEAAHSGPDETLLVADELASNAIRHVAEPFTVSLALSPSRALVAVTDPSRDEPILRLPGDPGAGRGMHVVNALSRSWGVRLVHDSGKTVWAALPPPLGSPAAAIPRSRGAW